MKTELAKRQENWCYQVLIIDCNKSCVESIPDSMSQLQIKPNIKEKRMNIWYIYTYFQRVFVCEIKTSRGVLRIQQYLYRVTKFSNHHTWLFTENKSSLMQSGKWTLRFTRMIDFGRVSSMMGLMCIYIYTIDTNFLIVAKCSVPF